MVNEKSQKTDSRFSKGTFPTYNGPLVYIYIKTILFIFSCSCNYFCLYIKAKQ